MIKLKNVFAVLFGIPIVMACLSLQYQANFFAGPYYFMFGLGPNSTVEQFRAASDNMREHWLNTMCNDGACLLDIDWLCGFSIDMNIHDESDEGWQRFETNVEACFLSLANKAPLEDKLSKLRLICGRRYMVFSGRTEDTDPDLCKEKGGEWGKKLPVFDDESNYTE